MEGKGGAVVHALPLERTAEVVARFGRR
jgi:hypothetical protein